MGRRGRAAAGAAPRPALRAGRDRGRRRAGRLRRRRARGARRRAAAARPPTAGRRDGPPADRRARPRPPRGRHRRDVAGLVHTGEPVLVVVADAALRARQLAPIVGGLRLCSHAALRADPGLADGAHVVVIDPPATPAAAVDLLAGAAGRTVHLAWGRDELDWTAQLHEREHELRAPLSAIYRALRALETAGARRSRRRCAGIRERPGRQRRPGARCGSSWSSASWTSTGRRDGHRAGRPAHIARRVGVVPVRAASYWTRDGDG